MQIIPFSQCSNELEFSRYRSWPNHLAAYSWRNYLLSHFSSENSQVLQLGNDLDVLAQVIPEIYPGLSLVEAAFLGAKLNTLGLDVLPNILSSSGLTLSENLFFALDVLLKMPPLFQDWLHEKRVGAKDLVVLRSISQLEDLFPVTNAISVKNPSRQFGIQILEMGCELLLMGKDIADLIPKEKDTVESWVAHLKKMRFPMSAQMDSLGREKLASLAWPAQVETQWQRRGDQTGVEIKFFAQSQSDLDKKITGIAQIVKAIKEKPELLWKN